MSLKKILLTALCLVGFITSFAQDKIYKKNGDVIEGKVTAVNIKNISYKRSDNPDGPEYTIYKKDVDKIVYQNGTQDEYDNDDEDEARSPRSPRPSHFKGHKGNEKGLKYGNNILAFAPLQLTNDNVQSSGGVGMSLSYERVLDKNGIISFYIPAIVTFTSGSNYNGYGNYSNSTYASYYFLPGIKFYPTGSKGIVRYSVGPSLVIAAGNTPDGYNNTINNFSGSYSIFGFMVNNSLNICPTPHLYIGLELGLGISYITNAGGTTYTSLGVDNGPMVQFAFKIGYRF